MKIILDNIIYSKSNNGGISNYWFELTKYLLNETSNDLMFIEGDKDLLNFHRKQLKISSESIITQNNSLSILNRILPIQFTSNDKFIYHSSFYRRLIGSKSHVEVTTIHDFTHNFYAPIINKTIHNWLKYSAINRSKGVICISKNTYSDLKKFCPTNKNQSVEVIYNGVSNDYYPIKNLTLSEQSFIDKLKLENNFILYVGSRANYKNFDFVIKTLNDIKNINLVVVGGGNFSSKEKEYITKNALENRILYISSATNSELNVLYNKALSFVYPSSYEGFGIPIIEAMRAGCPVIAFDNIVNREVTENKALLLKNLETNEFFKKLELLSNQDFRDEVVGNGIKLSSKYSWDKCCKETNEFYESLY